MKHSIHTDKAPQAIGPYSQAVKAGNFVFLSGQIPLDPNSMTVIKGDIRAQTKQVFENLQAVVEAAGATMGDFVKLNVYLTSMDDFAAVNEIMSDYFSEPYPARAAVEVSALPKGVSVEIEGTLFCP